MNTKKTDEEDEEKEDFIDSFIMYEESIHPFSFEPNQAKNGELKWIACGKI